MVLLSRRHYFGQPPSTKATSVQKHFMNSILLYSSTQFWVVIKKLPKTSPFSEVPIPKCRLESTFFFLFFVSLLSTAERTTMCCRTHTGVIIVSAVVTRRVDQRSWRSCWLLKQASSWSNLTGLLCFLGGFQATPLVPHSLHLLSCWWSSSSGADETQKPPHPTPIPNTKACDSNK